MQINRSFMFAATGLLKEAGEVLEKVDSTSLSDGLNPIENYKTIKFE